MATEEELLLAQWSEPAKPSGEEFYHYAASVLMATRAKQGSLKNLCYASPHWNKGKLIAISSESLRCASPPCLRSLLILLFFSSFFFFLLVAKGPRLTGD